MPYLSDVLPELDEAAFDPATDAKEIFEVGGGQPGGGDTVSLESAESVLVFVIDWRKMRAFTRWCLGFSYADEGPPYRLHRENPQAHPTKPNQTAATVHFSGVAPKANDKGTGAPAGSAPNYPAVFGANNNAIGRTGYYADVYATVRYVRLSHR